MTASAKKDTVAVAKLKSGQRKHTHNMCILDRAAIKIFSLLWSGLCTIKTNGFYRLSQSIIICLSAVCLSACVSYFKSPGPHPSGSAEGLMTGAVIGGTVVAASAGTALVPAGLVAGGIMGGAIGDYLTRHDTLLEQIKRQRVGFYRVGDDVTIVMPADDVFYGQSSVVKQRFRPVMGEIIKFVKRFDNKGTVKVAAFTDNTGWEKRNKAVTKIRADKVAGLLWDADIAAQLVYSKGYGSASPIASNGNLYGQKLNRRVEISFRLLPYQHV